MISGSRRTWLQQAQQLWLAVPVFRGILHEIVLREPALRRKGETLMRITADAARVARIVRLAVGVSAVLFSPAARADTIVNVPSPLQQTIDANVDLVNTTLSDPRVYFDVGSAVRAATGSGDLSHLASAHFSATLTYDGAFGFYSYYDPANQSYTGPTHYEIPQYITVGGTRSLNSYIEQTVYQRTYTSGFYFPGATAGFALGASGASDTASQATGYSSSTYGNTIITDADHVDSTADGYVHLLFPYFNEVTYQTLSYGVDYGYTGPIDIEMNLSSAVLNTIEQTGRLPIEASFETLPFDGSYTGAPGGLFLTSAQLTVDLSSSVPVPEVPEPSEWALAALGLVIPLARRRRPAVATCGRPPHQRP
jgi:MYXO-CTERM domain-containing protein